MPESMREKESCCAQNSMVNKIQILHNLCARYFKLSCERLFPPLHFLCKNCWNEVFVDIHNSCENGYRKGKDANEIKQVLVAWIRFIFAWCVCAWFFLSFLLNDSVWHRTWMSADDVCAFGIVTISHPVTYYLIWRHWMNKCATIYISLAADGMTTISLTVIRWWWKDNRLRSNAVALQLTNNYNQRYNETRE